MVFTELGVVMLTAVLRSAAAISVSIQIARAFVNMRRFLKKMYLYQFLLTLDLTIYQA